MKKILSIIVMASVMNISYSFQGDDEILKTHYQADDSVQALMSQNSDLSRNLIEAHSRSLRSSSITEEAAYKRYITSNLQNMPEEELKIHLDAVRFILSNGGGHFGAWALWDEIDHYYKAKRSDNLELSLREHKENNDRDAFNKAVEELANMPVFFRNTKLNIGALNAKNGMFNFDDYQL